MVGIKLSSFNGETNHVKLGPAKAIYYAGKEVIFVSISSLKYIGSMFGGSGDSSQLGGPIRIATYDFINKKMDIISDGPTDKSPALSSNGQMILYISLGSKGSRLMASSVDSRASYQLPDDGGAVRSPAWS